MMVTIGARRPPHHLGRWVAAGVVAVLLAPLGASPAAAQAVATGEPATEAALDPAAFVAAAYEGLLGRQPDDAGREYWLDQIERGVPPRAVIDYFGDSPEYRRHVVTEEYEELLERPPDRSGLEYWSGGLAVTLTLSALRSQLLGSAEYFATQGGSTVDGFLDALYQDVLGREPDEGGRQYFGELLAGATSRVRVADIVLDSPESLRQSDLSIEEATPAPGTVQRSLDSIEVDLDQDVVSQASTIVVSVDGRRLNGAVEQGDFAEVLVFTAGSGPTWVPQGTEVPVIVTVLGYDGTTTDRTDYRFRYRQPFQSLSRGEEGRSVRQLQARLESLGYWIGPKDGVYGRLTQQAVLAFQKVEGLERSGTVDTATARALEGARRPSPRSTSGTVAEVDLDRQVILHAVDGGTNWVWNTATGTNEPYTFQGEQRIADTPPGTYQILRQIDGVREAPLGRLYRPKYFTTTGIAFHGYPASRPSLPPTAASGSPTLPLTSSGRRA